MIIGRFIHARPRSLLRINRCLLSYQSNSAILRNKKDACVSLQLFRTKHTRFWKTWKSSRTPISWISVGILVCVGGASLYYVRQVKAQKRAERDAWRQKSVGKALIGGPFHLSDTEGKPVSNTDFLGSWMLIYFGFTHCPDVCPDELEKLSKAIQILDATRRGDNLKLIFISVDPYRDTPDKVKKYLSEFSPRFIGLTGTIEQTRVAAKSYRIYFSEGPKDDDDDYIVDHSIITYLVNPEGEFVDYYGKSRTAETIAGGVTAQISKYESEKKQEKKRDKVKTRGDDDSNTTSAADKSKSPT